MNFSLYIERRGNKLTKAKLINQKFILNKVFLPIKGPVALTRVILTLTALKSREKPYRAFKNCWLTFKELLHTAKQFIFLIHQTNT